MEYITGKKCLPGALSDDAAALFVVIWQAIRWQPCFSEMSKAEIDAFGELQRACYVEACAWGEYRVKGRDTISAIREYQQERNAQLNMLYAGTDPLIAKWEARVQIINFRLRPWRSSRVQEAHIQHWNDVQETLSELRRIA